jgi:DNA invertase Pin-like site-specific DNA recombinase
VAKLDRLSRSVLDLAGLLDRSRRDGWGLILLDLDLDTTTAAGKLVAHLMSAVAEFERQRISERTSEALAQARKRGVQLGRPRVISDAVIQRITHERDRGLTLQQIADGLNSDGISPAHHGREWYHSTVRSILSRGQDDPRILARG